MPEFDAASEPFLNGIFAPTQSELDGAPVEVIAGALPPDLAGTYFRNGPNARFTPLGSYTYPLDGDGMIHAVRLRGGRATYSNRYVRTPSLAAEERAGHALWGGVFTPRMPNAEEAGPEMAGLYKDLPDVNVVHHAGRLLALAESARPFALDARLATIGPWYFDGSLPAGITAHPKRDPLTGELVVFRYAFEPPYLTWAVVGANGVVTRTEQPIPVDASYMIHDCALTRSWLVLFICPATFDMTRAQALRWEPERGTRIALVPRDGSGAVRFLATDAFWVWHFANAFEDTDAAGAARVVVDYAHWSALAMGHEAPTGALRRAWIDPAACRVTFETLDDRVVEFPRIDDRRIAGAHRYIYAAAKSAQAGTGTFDLVRRFDTQTGRVDTYGAGDARIGEPVFAPAARDSDEDDGYVLTYRYAGDVTDLLVLHARDIEATPAAVLRMPQRVPFGLHGNWVADAPDT